MNSKQRRKLKRQNRYSVSFCVEDRLSRVEFNAWKKTIQGEFWWMNWKTVCFSIEQDAIMCALRFSGRQKIKPL